MRNLATIQTIKDLQQIKDADQIEVATIQGWHLVVKKGEFKVGDRCVYFEVDSFLPIRPEFEFLAKAGTKKMLVEGKEVEGYRLRTIKLRGQVSQGLALPLDILPDGYLSELANNNVTLEDGLDVSDIIGVIKYEPPIPASLSGVVKGVFPAFIPKTDEPRIQNTPDLMIKYKDRHFYITEKIDGTSMTVYAKDGELNVCGRNMNLKETPDNSLWKVARELDLEKKLSGMPIALQGELYGEGIQSNKLKIKGHKYAVYNAYNYEENRYLNFAEFCTLCDKLGVQTVPILDDKFILLNSVDELVTLATRKSAINPEVWVEGIVIRPLIEAQDEDLGRLSFKVINPEFLLEYKE